MPLVPANQPQLIRSSQKDDYYQTSLRNNANEAFQTLAGKIHTNHEPCVRVICARGTQPCSFSDPLSCIVECWCVRAKKTLKFSTTRFGNLSSSSLCIFSPPFRIKKMAAVEERSGTTIRSCLLCTNHSLGYIYY